jgi:DNA ligase-1
VEALKDMKTGEAILEGEVIAVNPEGSPLPFQVLMRRLGRVREVEKLLSEVPVKLYLFDILYKDGRLLVDAPYEERWEALEETGATLVPRTIPESVEQGEAFFSKALKEGYEGLVAKALSSPYTPGVRGKAWLKLKKAVSLDLVIVAADWGYGRRYGWLSNYHLAARDEETGRFLPVGKTYKGFTDREFEEMTERLKRLKTGEAGGTVFVRPEVVVEVLFSEVQQSPRYESGLALRFARISRIRDDKAASEADTIGTIREIYKGRSKTPTPS